MRRAFLCGEDRYTGQSFEHHRQWAEDRFHELSEIFALSVCPYAVMSNHLHVVVQIQPEAASGWTEWDFAKRKGTEQRGRRQLTLLNYLRPFCCVQDTLNQTTLTALAGLGLAQPMLLPVVAEEAHGANAIPLVLAQQVGAALDWPVETRVIQSNVVGRTRKDGYYRLAFQPLFEGESDPDRDYVLVDDFIGQGRLWPTCGGTCWPRAGGSRASPMLSRLSGDQEVRD